MTNLTLYNYFRSSTSYRARIALHLKNLEFNYKPIHLLKNGGEQHSEEYRKLNPIGGIPTLVHDDKVISQSVAIIEYLDEAFSNTLPLFPKELYLKAKVRQVCETINSDIHPYGNLKVMQYLEKIHHFTTEQKNSWSQKWIHDGFSATEKIISETAKDYCFGNTVTAADVFLIPQIFAAGRVGINIKNYPLLDRINENCLKLPAFQKAHPFSQIDTPAEEIKA